MYEWKNPYRILKQQIIESQYVFKEYEEMTFIYKYVLPQISTAC